MKRNIMDIDIVLFFFVLNLFLKKFGSNTGGIKPNVLQYINKLD